MIAQEHRRVLDASFRIAREPAIDGLAAILHDHPNPDHPRSEFATRKLAEGVVVGVYGMFVRDIAVPRFAEDLGRNLFGITDGADETEIDILTFLESNLRSSIPSDIRDAYDREITRLCMRLMVGWVQRREQLAVGGAAGSPTVEVATSGQGPGAVLQAAVEQSPIGVYVTDYQSAEPVVNNAAHQQMFGYSMAEELVLEPEHFQDQETADDDFDLLADLVEGRIPYLERVSSRPHKDGHSVPYHALSWPIRDDGGRITHLFNLISPATRSDATSGSGLAEKRARYLLRLSPDPVVITTDRGDIRYASPSVGSVLGYDPDMLIGTPVESLLTQTSVDAGRRMMDAVIGAPFTRIISEMEMLLQDGTSRWFELVATNLLAVDDVQGIVLQGRDVTERRMFQEQLERAAHIDALTGLLNRRGFLERLQSWLEEHDSANARGSSVACYIDLDRFKRVNDRHGHGAGDAVLVAVGERLAILIDGRGFAGRIGGDEFVLLAEIDDRSGRERFDRELMSALNGIALNGGQSIAFVGSAGIIELQGESQMRADALGILHDADERLTQVKIERRISMDGECELA